MYKVTLADGTVLNNLEYNGNNFCTKEEINPDIFKDNISEVTIEFIGSNVEDNVCPITGTHTDLILIQCRKFGDTWMFIVAKPTVQQKIQKNIQLLSDRSDVTEEAVTDIEMALVDIYEQIIGE